MWIPGLLLESLSLSDMERIQNSQGLSSILKERYRCRSKDIEGGKKEQILLLLAQRYIYIYLLILIYKIIFSYRAIAAIHASFNNISCTALSTVLYFLYLINNNI